MRLRFSIPLVVVVAMVAGAGAGTPRKLQPGVVPDGDGWWCATHSEGTVLSLCERTLAKCDYLRKGVIDSECVQQPRAACLTYWDVMQETWQWTCKSSMHSCKHARETFIDLRPDDFTQVSACAVLK